MSYNFPISTINTSYIQNSQLSQPQNIFAQYSQPVSTGLVSEQSAPSPKNNTKRNVIIGAAVTIAAVAGLALLAKNGKLGDKAKSFVDGIINKIKPKSVAKSESVASEVIKANKKEGMEKLGVSIFRDENSKITETTLKDGRIKMEALLEHNNNNQKQVLVFDKTGKLTNNVRFWYKGEGKLSALRSYDGNENLIKEVMKNFSTTVDNGKTLGSTISTNIKSLTESMARIDEYNAEGKLLNSYTMGRNSKPSFSYAYDDKGKLSSVLKTTRDEAGKKVQHLKSVGKSEVLFDKSVHVEENKLLEKTFEQLRTLLGIS